MIAILYALCVFAMREAHAAPTITATTSSVPMGRSVTVEIKGDPGAVYFPFVNGTQWGAFCTATGDPGGCSILLPLPVPGAARVQVAALDRMWCQQPFTTDKHFCVGQPLPAAATAAALSNTVTVEVVARRIAPPVTNNKTVCLDWEPCPSSFILWNTLQTERTALHT